MSPSPYFSLHKEPHPPAEKGVGVYILPVYENYAKTSGYLHSGFYLRDTTKIILHGPVFFLYNFCRSGSFHKDDKFIAPESSYDINAPECFEKKHSHLVKNFISRSVAFRIIECLKSIQIHNDKRTCHLGIIEHEIFSESFKSCFFIQDIRKAVCHTPVFIFCLQCIVTDSQYHDYICDDGGKRQGYNGAENIILTENMTHNILTVRYCQFLRI